MTNYRFEKGIVLAVLLSLWFIFPLFAFPPSPAGSWLEIFSQGEFASVEDHDDFDFNLAKKEFTIEMWVYIEQIPKPDPHGFPDGKPEK